MFGFLYSALAGKHHTPLSDEKIANLLSSQGHSPLLGRYRATVILSRIRIIALVAAALYIGGIAIDGTAFDGDHFELLVIFRVTGALLLIALVFAIRKSETMASAYRALALFFSINLVFQALSQPLILPQYIASIDSLPTAGYALFPFLVICCLAIFPLTAKEGFMAALLCFLGELIAISLMPNQVNPAPGLGVLASLIIASAICAFSAISQLAYMVSLIEQASVDVLTHCFSRNSGEEILEVQFRIARRQKTPLSVIFMDLDDFKEVNDHHGHDAGDRVLSAASAALRRNLRDSDILIRWGGEEFLMLLPHTDAKGATNAIRRMRTNGLGTRPDGRKLTASIGIAELQESEAETWMDLVDLADEQMYCAKTSGKNDYSVYQPRKKVALA
ncbi:diguanylate cyclase [Sneathiella sp.]|jgi:diguanylate cyclase (GGDEF)-like protein|uniref:GGDEF domain-containing protein n=1 Tax=Sneathiella sp. TaxID=1964365 RepID=UPI0039E629E7